MSGYMLLGLVAVLLLYLLSDVWGGFRSSKIPSKTSYVKVIMRYAEIRKRHSWNQREKIYLVLLQMKDGTMREFQVGEGEYNVLQEGMTGLLVWQENRYISFEEF